MTQSNTSYSCGSDDPIEYFIPKYLLNPQGMMAVEVLQNEKISGGKQNKGGEKESVLLSVKKQIEKA